MATKQTSRGEWRRWLARMLADGDPTSCWEWPFGKNKRGYGQITIDGRKDMAHRAIFSLVSGEAIPPGFEVLHNCDNPPCVNPRHLLTGTHKQNMDDMIAKGRHRAPVGERSGRSKLSEAQVLAIRNSVESTRALAEQYQVSDVHVWMIRTGRTWRHLKPI